MKTNITLLALLCCISFGSFKAAAQVGINTTTPGATLDISGKPTVTTELDGVIPPRITGDQLRAKTYTAAQTAAIVYVTKATTTPVGQTINVTVPGYFYFNGTAWIALTPAGDADFFKVGTFVPPTLITEDVWRTGKVAIGKATPSYALDIDDLTTTRALNINTTAATPGIIYGAYINNQNTDPGSSDRYGVFTKVSVPTGQANKVFGNYVDLTGAGGTDQHVGTFNRLVGNENRNIIGTSNYFTGGGNGEQIGVSNNISSTGTGDHIGVQNKMQGTGLLRGVYNTFNNSSGSGENRGMETQSSNDNSGIQKGFHSRLDGNGTGEKIGTFNYITGQKGKQTGISNVLKRDGVPDGTNTGTGDKIGTNNYISDSQGDNYGVYNSIANTVIGKTSWGTYNTVNSVAGTNIGGYFSATGTGGTAYYAAIFDKGNVGIGTIAPAATNLLEVNGKVQATTLKLTTLPVFASDAAATASTTIVTGDLYRVGTNVRIK